MMTVALGDVAEIERHGVDPSVLPAATLYLGLEHIERGGRIIGHATVGGAALASTKFTFSTEHVLYGKLRPNLGKVSRPEFAGVCSTDILPIRPGPRLDRSYLAHYLVQPSMVQFAAARAAGANLPRLSPTVLAKFPIPLPRLDEQRRIAAILDQADTLRVKRRQVLARLDALRQSALSSRVATTEWTHQIREMADVQIGPFGSLLHQRDYVRDGVPVLNPSHIRQNGLYPERELTVSAEKATTLSIYRLRPGDVIMGRRGEMARAAVVTQEHAGFLCGTGSLILRPNGSDSVFLHAVVTSARMKAHLEQSSLGATLPNLNAEIVNSSPVPMPSMHEQRAFSAIAAQQDATVGYMRAASEVEDSLFRSLQSRAFRGEL